MQKREKTKNCTRNKMHERNKNKMQREVQAVIWGVQELKKDYWAKRERGGVGPWEKENRTGLVQVNRTDSGLII